MNSTERLHLQSNQISALEQKIKPVLRYPLTEKVKGVVGENTELHRSFWKFSDEPAENDLVQFPEGAPGFAYAKIGDILFLDHRMQEILDSFYIDDIRKNIVWFHDFKSIAGLQTFFPYSALTASLVASQKLEGLHVLELGAADGFQSLTAMRFGAAQTTAVEINPRYEPFFQRHVAVNGFDPDRMAYAVADLTRSDLSNKVDLNTVDIVVANLGPYYEDADLQAIDLLEQMPQVKKFIGGGYLAGYEKYDSAKALDALKEIGFSKNRKDVTMKETTKIYVHSFIVERNG